VPYVTEGVSCFYINIKFPMRESNTYSNHLWCFIFYFWDFTYPKKGQNVCGYSCGYLKTATFLDYLSYQPALYIYIVFVSICLGMLHTKFHFPYSRQNFFSGYDMSGTTFSSNSKYWSKAWSKEVKKSHSDMRGCLQILILMCMYMNKLLL
jgi:hypothetical protein